MIPGMVPAQGQCPIPYRRLSSELPGGEGDPDNSPSAQFTGSCPRLLLPLPKGEVRAGWPLNDPGELPEKLGGGCPDYPQGRLRHCLFSLDGAKRKVHTDRRRLCRKNSSKI